jgi:LmbE family N-acetylglucosaminyl deacetylase
MKYNFINFLAVLILPFSVLGQNLNTGNSSHIFHRIEKLKVLGSVLYVAAHPDDENTGMITYFANERKMKTTYLSITRGDGGQNLIGPEKFQWMGLIRTQELLEARKIDGGQQAFTRAFDFGYSKTPKETLRIWNEDSILSDVVWMIRKLRPDIIITRFAPDTLRKTHGHHTSSALLTKKAFDLSDNKTSFPRQFKYLDPWQAKRLFFNTSWWFYGKRDFDKSGLIELETGQYNPLLGQSYGEISAESRSMHKSQGFGVMRYRGSDLEYLKPIKGPASESDPFEGINTTWSRVKNGEGIGELIDATLNSFDEKNPEKSLAQLLVIRSRIAKVEDEFWKKEKLKEVNSLILDCLGVWVEALGGGAELVPGNPYPFTLTVIQRLGNPMVLKNIRSDLLGYSRDFKQDLKTNELVEIEDTILIPAGLPYTVPYWLKEPMLKGRFVVKDQRQIGKPENDPEVPFVFTFNLQGEDWEVETRGVFKWRDRVNGEMQKELVIVPSLVACFNDKNVIFPADEAKNVAVRLHANREVEGAIINLDLPWGWKVTPSQILISMAGGEEKQVEFSVDPPGKDEMGIAGIRVRTGDMTHNFCKVQIEHDHIRPITAVIDNGVRFVRVDIKNTAKIVGYVDGAGDEIPQALIQLGSELRYLGKEDFYNGNLDDLDAIVMGVRSYNTNSWLPNVQEKLMNYVKNGGNLMIQYNVTYGLLTEELGPYPLKVSRDRVTDENARITLLKPASSVFNSPNKITEKDFEGWVQERGLYFPNEWDERYEALISCHDPGEKESRGSLLVTSYGKGTFIYSGLSWFRQLPAGVGGAYRIFANLISAKNDSQ